MEDATRLKAQLETVNIQHIHVEGLDLEGYDSFVDRHDALDYRSPYRYAVRQPSHQSRSRVGSLVRTDCGDTPNCTVLLFDRYGVAELLRHDGINTFVFPTGVRNRLCWTRLETSDFLVRHPGCGGPRLQRVLGNTNH